VKPVKSTRQGSAIRVRAKRHVEPTILLQGLKYVLDYFTEFIFLVKKRRQMRIYSNHVCTVKHREVPKEEQYLVGS
jgi:hypothetical protein